MKGYSRALAPTIKQSAPKPKIELTEQQVRGLKTAAEVLLAVVGVVGIGLVSIAAPKALQAFKYLKANDGKRVSYDWRRKKVARSFYYLKHQGYVNLKRNKNDFEINLTDKGKRKYERIRLDILKIKKPLIWDGKFWQVAADIPVKYRKGADALRRQLKQMGFYALQRTLWFYPYDPRKEIDWLARQYRIGEFVTVMKVSTFDYADLKVLRDHFRETGVVEF